ncbi:hypothetical protein GCM10010919_27680 [Alishewanella longhuensis]|uniref:Uncharacterized protein n=1 Tax=Alishewanella longhuensis TaxID=1091037 RepID=A0ABQ3L1T7_9ALTE|nr:hypothetical protein [Alishewanella longhuensis]GHG74305.1 hypothetical protein GCM10010919_27680 [Alishewanella longhuensis]
MSYTINEHRHRFAAWAAGRAASVNGCRFTVEDAKIILERSAMVDLIAHPNDLPIPLEMDSFHRSWRNKIILEAEKIGLTNFTHGVAAKLINIYLKAAFVCGGYHEHERVKALHPPIDSVLLDELYSKNTGGLKKNWSLARKIRWSKFNSDEYEAVISAIRKVNGDRAMWEIEKFWRGYQ